MEIAASHDAMDTTPRPGRLELLFAATYGPLQPVRRCTIQNYRLLPQPHARMRMLLSKSKIENFLS